MSTLKSNPKFDEISCGSSHSLDDVSHYEVVETVDGVGGIVSAGIFDATDYAKAVERANHVRMAHVGPRWARIDAIYNDGCRVIR